MAAETSVFRKSDAAAVFPWRGLAAAVLALAVGWGGIVYAANNSVQGAKKDEGGFDGDAPTAISPRHGKAAAASNLRETGVSAAIGDVLNPGLLTVGSIANNTGFCRLWTKRSDCGAA